MSFRSALAATLTLAAVLVTEVPAQGFAEPKWSPDGSRLAFVANAATEFSYDIFVVGSNGQGLRRVACSPKADYQPSWSPDGKQIVFHSARDGAGALFIHDLATSSTRRLTPQGQEASGAAWAPDGKRLVYQVHAGDYSNLWVITPDGTGARAITSGSNTYEDASWSPTGDRIIVTAATGRTATVVSMRPDGQDVRTLIDAKWGSPHGARMSRDGRWIAFHTSLAGNPEVYVIAADGTRDRRLTDHPERDYVSEWAGDNEVVIWSGREGPQRFFHLNVGDGGARKIALTDGFAANAPCGEKP